MTILELITNLVHKALTEVTFNDQLQNPDFEKQIAEVILNGLIDYAYTVVQNLQL